MVTLTVQEREALSPGELKEHLADEEMTVFGRTKSNEPAYKKIKGTPVEQGVGAHGHETGNHFQAILKYQGDEAHQDALREIWKRDPTHAKKLSLPQPRALKKAD